MQKGERSIAYEIPVYFEGEGSVVGKKEGEGPLGQLFDEVVEDPMFGENSWEEAESELQVRAAKTALKKSGLERTQIRYLFAGDLEAQGVASSFGMSQLEIPFFGVFGACSTMGESLILGSSMVAAGQANSVLCVTSSHFASAEKEFRFPLEYGNQRPLSAGWTVTGSGACVLGRRKKALGITAVTPGRIVDYGMKDSFNMGACMAPAAVDTIEAHFKDMARGPEDYDAVFTGDLGVTGSRILIEQLAKKGYDIEKRHDDCGLRMYDIKKQDAHAGGSGCGCAASVLMAYILPRMKEEGWQRILFVPTGALLSKVSFAQGRTIPAIAHAVCIERV